ncbi:MAG: helix-turn-helix transcriptional regulator [Deltaproteobacteria bacterium]|nr:helix-turn-helix transcriptional regulator [Deltaproteobacteria bacterium]
MSIAARLKAARESLGKSQKEMANTLSASFRAWQDYEAGNNVPGGRVFEALARLGFNTNWLLIGEGPMRLDGEGHQGAATGPEGGDQLDTELIGEIIEEVERGLQKNNLQLPPEKLRKLVFVIYDGVKGGMIKESELKNNVILLTKMAG